MLADFVCDCPVATFGAGVGSQDDRRAAGASAARRQPYVACASFEMGVDDDGNVEGIGDPEGVDRRPVDAGDGDDFGNNVVDNDADVIGCELRQHLATAKL